MFEAKNSISSAPNTASAIIIAIFQRPGRTNVTKAIRSVVTIIVPDTAMP